MLKKLWVSKTSIIPTWRFWLSFLMILIAMFASINYQKSILHWLAYTLLFTFVCSIVYNLFAVAALKSTWSYKNRIFQGELLNIQFKIQEFPIPAGKIYQGNTVFNKHIKLPVGVHTIEKLKLLTEYPFGFFKTYITLPNIDNVYVYPKAIDHTKNNQDQTKTPITDIYRPFINGDSPKRILKKTMTLPQNKWQSKKDSTENQFNTSTELNWYKLNENLSSTEKLEQLSYYIHNMSDKTAFSLILPTKRIANGYGLTHKHNALKILAETWQQMKL